MSTFRLLMNLAEEVSALNRHFLRQMTPFGPHFPSPPSIGFPTSIFDRIPEHLNEPCYRVQKQNPIGKDGFKVSVDVSEFKPNELTVKTIENSVVIEARHKEDRADDGFVSKEFVRRYVLPKGYDPKLVVSTLNSEGLLTVAVPKSPELEPKEHIVNIQQIEATEQQKPTEPDSSGTASSKK